MVKYKDKLLDSVANWIDLIVDYNFKDVDEYDIALGLPRLDFKFAWDDRWRDCERRGIFKVRFRKDRNTKEQLEEYLNSQETQEWIEWYFEAYGFPIGIEDLMKRADIIDFPFMKYVPDENDIVPEKKIVYNDETIEMALKDIKLCFGCYKEEGDVDELDLSIRMPYLDIHRWSDKWFQGNNRFHKVHFNKNDDIRKQLEDYLYSDETQRWINGYVKRAASRKGKEIMKDLIV